MLKKNTITRQRHSKGKILQKYFSLTDKLLNYSVKKDLLKTAELSITNN